MKTDADCFICGRPTIGLEGIETTLDTYMLDASLEGQELLAQNWFGACHYGCLTNHRSGAIWSVFLKKHFLSNLRYQVVEEYTSASLLKVRRPEGYLVLFKEGFCVQLTKDELPVISEAGGAGSIKRERRQGILARLLDVGLETWLSTARRSGASVDLGEAYERLGVPLVGSWSPGYFEGTLEFSGGASLQTTGAASINDGAVAKYSIHVPSLK